MNKVINIGGGETRTVEVPSWADDVVYEFCDLDGGGNYKYHFIPITSKRFIHE